MLPPFDLWRSSTVASDVAQASTATHEELARRCRRRLEALLRAASRTGVYGPSLKGRDLSTLRLAELPLVRKRDLMQRFDEWVTDPALRLPDLQRFVTEPRRVADPFARRYVVWQSSGSSGDPALFVQDAAALAVYDALEALRRPSPRSLRQLMNPWQGGEQVAFVGATDGHFASNVSMERLRRLNPLMAQRLHGLSFLQPTAELVKQLNALAPMVLATYPGAAVLLAEEQAAGRLTLELQELWTGGETLTPAMRRFVQQAFGCQVVNSYGASEFLTLACECAQGQLHLNADWAILEPVDGRGRPVPDGETGATTLLTNLANHVQPLIRYDLGDRVRLHPERCACGSSLPVIEVEGRCDDILRLGRPAVTVAPMAITSVLEDEAGLYEFQLVQQGPGELLLTTAAEGRDAQALLRRGESALLAYLQAQGCKHLRLDRRSGEPARRTASGKIQRVMCLTGDAEGGA
jgi:phenylacetate-coenzyme A ligase PaaK-like adenylate-forming protein